jgi:hypothetical protein
MYRLTLGYHSIGSSVYTYIVTFIVQSHLFFIISKYFHKFCICALQRAIWYTQLNMFYNSYMFRRVCAILRDFTHQI